MFFVLTVAYFLLLTQCHRVEVVEKCTVDTIVFNKVDTIREYYPKYITKRVVDTIYLETKGDSILPLNVIQKHYSRNNSYDVWVSGIEPLSMDSINVYSKTEYKTIHKDVVREIRPLEWNIYVGSGFKTISRDFVPELSISLATPKKWLITANLSIYDGDIIYGGSVSYKIK